MHLVSHLAGLAHTADCRSIIFPRVLTGDRLQPVAHRGWWPNLAVTSCVSDLEKMYQLLAGMEVTGLRSRSVNTVGQTLSGTAAGS